MCHQDIEKWVACGHATYSPLTPCAAIKHCKKTKTHTTKHTVSLCPKCTSQSRTQSHPPARSAQDRALTMSNMIRNSWEAREADGVNQISRAELESQIAWQNAKRQRKEEKKIFRGEKEERGWEPIVHEDPVVSVEDLTRGYDGSQMGPSWRDPYAFTDLPAVGGPDGTVGVVGLVASAATMSSGGVSGLRTGHTNRLLAPPSRLARSPRDDQSQVIAGRSHTQRELVYGSGSRLRTVSSDDGAAGGSRSSRL